MNWINFCDSHQLARKIDPFTLQIFWCIFLKQTIFFLYNSVQTIFFITRPEANNFFSKIMSHPPNILNELPPIFETIRIEMRQKHPLICTKRRYKNDKKY